MRAAVLAAMLTIAPPAIAEEQPFPGIEALMTEAEFEAAGLDGLRPRELRALDAWLADLLGGDAVMPDAPSAPPAAVAAPPAPVETETPSRDAPLVSRIRGDFTGWSGDTVFELENGQVWRQRIDGRYLYRGPPNPEVRIERNWLGLYVLRLTEGGRAVGVERVP